MSDDEVHAIVERCRRKLLSYSFTSAAARQECWDAERELYELEETLFKEWCADERQQVLFT